MTRALALAAALWASAAHAEMQCFPHAAAAILLADSYGEVQQSIGLSGDALFEMFANVETGTWTLIMTTAEGVSCVIAVGERYEAVRDAAGDPA